MEKVTLTRKEFYDLVWSNSLLSLSRKYNISDNGLRKMCNRMKIPIPNRKYWQQKLNNHKVKANPLSTDFYEQDKVVLYIRDPNMAKPEISAKRKLQLKLAEIQADNRLNLSVPHKLTNPVKLIAEAHKSLKNKDNGHFRYSSGDVRVLNIIATSKTINRALRFLDTFIKLIRSRGHDIHVSSYKSYVVIDDENVEFKINEKTQMIKKDGGHGFIPSGKLKFAYGSQFEKMIEDDKLPIEEKLSLILAKLELMAKRLKKERLEHEERHRLYEEEQKRIRDAKARKEKEVQDVKNLITSVNHWHQSNLIRNFITEYESHASKNGMLNDDLVAWFGWAREKADWLDPFVKKVDPYLKEEDKNQF